MPGTLADPGVVLHAARICVWSRWFILLVGVFQIIYRPGFWYPEDIEYLPLLVLLLLLNSLAHYRLLTNRPVTWRWILLPSTIDIALITTGIVIGGGFKSFVFLAYYPALAVFAMVFSSFWLSLAWTTTAAVVYVVVCLTVGSGLDLDAGNEKVLVARLAAMYTVVLGISVIIRFERIRWQTAVARERQLQQERIELSQTIHDTAAQTAYMIGLGIHRARKLAGESIAGIAVSTGMSRSHLSRRWRPQVLAAVDAEIANLLRELRTTGGRLVHAAIESCQGPPPADGAGPYGRPQNGVRGASSERSQPRWTAADRTACRDTSELARISRISRRDVCHERT